LADAAEPTAAELEAAAGDSAATDVAPDKPKRVRKPRTRGPRKPRASRTAAASGAGDKAPRAPRARKAALGPRIANLYTMAGLGLAAVPNPATAAAGMAMVQNAAELGKAWEALAKDNPRVADALESLLTVSTVGTVVLAHLPVVFAALAAGGKLPPHLAALAGIDLATAAERDAAEEAGGAAFDARFGSDGVTPL
jgi:hypothetical protein